MYFLPILLALTTYLLIPSVVLAAAVGLALAAYCYWGGYTVNRETVRALRAQIAYRIICVKLLALNGPIDEDTYTAHAKLTPDEPEAAELRGILRDAASTSGAGWQLFAKTVRKVYGRDPGQLVERFELLLLQLRCQPCAISEDTQVRLVELCKLWKIGPNKAKSFFEQYKIPQAPAMLAWN